MTIARRRLEEAAFWNFHVCVECEKLFDPEVQGGTRCPDCNTMTFPADVILQCADLVEPYDD